MLKKSLSLMMVLALIFSTTAIGIPMTVHAAGTIYYVSSSTGNDSNNGTSTSTPWKTLVKASSQAYVPGDQILLKCGDTWTSEGNTYDDGYYSASRTHNYYQTGFRSASSGTPANPIVLSSYGTGLKPIIKGVYSPDYSQYNSDLNWGGLVAGFNSNNGSNTDYYCVFIENPNGWSISNLNITNAQGGIVLWNNAGHTNDTTNISNIDFADIDGIDFFSNDNPDGTNPAFKNSVHFRVTYSAGVILTGDSYTGDNSIRGKNITLSNLRGIRTKCLFMPARRSNNAWEKYPDGTQVNYQNINLTDSSSSGGTFGWWMEGVNGGTANNIVCTNAGVSPFSCGPTVGGMQDCMNFNVTNCEFIGAQKNTVDGCGLDFEGNNTNVFVQNCIFKNNQSGGVMYYGTNGINKNTTVDHCTFIQDEILNNNNGEVFLSVVPDSASKITNCTFEKAQAVVDISNGSMTNSGNVDAVADTIIVDDANTASTSYSGSWIDLPLASAQDQTPYMLGAKYASPGSGAYMTFNPVVPTTQQYNVYAWWTEHANRSTVTPYTVYDGTNSYTVNENQTINGGKWNLVGTYTLKRGSTPYVKVTAPSAGYAIADAIKIVPVTSATRLDRTVWKLTNQDPSIDGFTGNSVADVDVLPMPDNTLYNITASDPFIVNGSINVPSVQNQVIIKMKNNTASTQGKLYFKTSGSNSWDETKSKTFTITANDTAFKTYAIDMSGTTAWTGTITGIRFDIEPGTTTGSFNMAEIYLLTASN